MTTTPAPFITATLRGGAFNGQVVNVPDTETRLQFYDAGHPVVYYKLARPTEFFSEDHPAIRGWHRGRR